MMRKAWPWLRALFAVAILGVLAWRLGTGAFLDGLRAIDVRAILAALGIGALTTVLSAWRWCLVARKLGLRLSLRRAIADYYQALFVNGVLPFGVLGDVQRAVRHGQHTGDVGRGVRAVVLERTAGQAVLAVVTVAVLIAQPAVASVAVHDLLTAPAAVIFAVLCVLAIAVVAVIRWGRRSDSTSKWRRGVNATMADVRVGLLSRDVWPAVLILSTVVLAGHLTLFMVAARAAGSTVPLVQLLPPMVLTLVASGVPVNIGGWGPRESVSALAFGAAGLGAAQGLTIAVVYGVLTLVTSLPGAVVLLGRYAARLRTGRRSEVQLEERVVAEDKAA
jgi:uncharacterized membrane protein YbhN (UPF0104 family)